MTALSLQLHLDEFPLVVCAPCGKGAARNENDSLNRCELESQSAPAVTRKGNHPIGNPYSYHDVVSLGASSGKGYEMTDRRNTHPTQPGTALWAVAALVGSAWLCVAHGTSGAAQRSAPENLDAGGSCVASECHAAVKKHSTLHFPTSMDMCVACHEQKGDKHEFTVADGPALCATCHDAIVPKNLGKQGVHAPVQDGCVGCHDPHGSEAEKFLRADTVKDLCLLCHGDAILEGKHKHLPAEQGMCLMCHDPHSSSLPKLLREKGRKLCADCHADIVEAAEEAAVDHGAVLTEKECVNCHSPHASDHEHMLKAPVMDLCVGCHKKPMRSGNSQILNMKEWLDNNDGWHGPVIAGDCVACHQPHGGARFRMLVKPFPARFYASFSASTYELCFSCHDSSMVSEERTHDATEFRDGSRNLHFLHVNRKKGRTCRACHDVHASRLPHHIREQTPFGKWLVPIDYEARQSGGSCRPGCHPPATYNRHEGK